MSHNADVDEAFIVVDGVDYAVVSDPDSPQIGSSLQLDAPVRPWIGREALDARNDPSRHGGLKLFEFPPSRAGEDNSVLNHAAAGARAHAASRSPAARGAPRLAARPELGRKSLPRAAPASSDRSGLPSCGQCHPPGTELLEPCFIPFPLCAERTLPLPQRSAIGCEPEVRRVDLTHVSGVSIAI